MAFVNKERMLHEFLELVQVDSPTKGERLVADILKKKLLALGAEVFEDNVGEKIGGDTGNVFAYFKGNQKEAPIIILSAHMDVVAPCLGVKPEIKDGVISTNGETVLGGDDKAGIVPILEGIRVIKENNILHGDIQVIFTVAEEGGLNGSKNIDKNLLKGDYAYVFDTGGNPGEVVVAAPGQDSIDVVVHGKASHAGTRPEEGINAIFAAAKAVSAMQIGRIDEETTCNVGIIQGGVATNIVPDKVFLECEARSRNLQKLEKQTNLMQEVFQKEIEKYGARAEIKVTREYNPYTLNEESMLVKLVEKASKQAGLEFKCKPGGGGSDANFFNAFGVPAAVLATGMTNVHSTREILKEIDLYNTGEMVLAILIEVAKLKGKDLK